MKIIKSLEEAGLLIKTVSETIKNEAKQQKEGLLVILENLLTGKGTITAGEDTIRTGQDFSCRLIL